MSRPFAKCRRRSITPIAGMLFLACALATTSCTAIGYSIGRDLDAKAPRQVEVSRSQWPNLKHGKTVLIARKYGTSTDRFKLIDVIQTADGSVVEKVDASTPFAEIRLRLERVSYDEPAGRGFRGVDTLEIATDRITVLYLPRSSVGGRLCFTVIGLALDAAILSIFALSWDATWGLGSGGAW